MKVLQIENGIVSNIIVMPDEGDLPENCIACPDDPVNIGWPVVDGAVVPPPDDLVKPKWQDGAWVEAETEDEKKERGRAALAGLERGMITAPELLAVLLDKGVIKEADLPAGTQEKLAKRAKLKTDLGE